MPHANHSSSARNLKPVGGALLVRVSQSERVDRGAHDESDTNQQCDAATERSDADAHPRAESVAQLVQRTSLPAAACDVAESVQGHGAILTFLSPHHHHRRHHRPRRLQNQTTKMPSESEPYEVCRMTTACIPICTDPRARQETRSSTVLSEVHLFVISLNV